MRLKVFGKIVLRASQFPWLCLVSVQALIAAFPPVQAQSAAGQIDVLTQRYDSAHSGCNSQERLLTPSTVNPKTFGKLFSREVDGEVYAQPLVVSSLTLPKRGQRNVVFVATQHNSVYAFDADDPNAEKPFWHVNLGHPVSTQDVGSACGIYSDISHEVGITGTPVIDAQTKTLYLVSRTKDLKATSPQRPAGATQTQAADTAPADPQLAQADATPPVDPASPLINDSRGFHQYLHALDLVTGKERPHSPVEIRAQVPGQGLGSVKGVLAFNPRIHNQRAALLLHQGVVYLCWAGHCDSGAYHGWMMGYNARTLAQTTVFCTTPNGRGAGIWQSGGGPSVDEHGDIYIVTGNGSVDTDRPGAHHTEYGSSVLRLQARQGRLQVADFFTPYNYTSLGDADLDTGSTSVMLLPGTDLVASGSKAGVLYLMNRRKLGGFSAFSDEQIVQKMALSSGFLYSTPVVWKRPDGCTWLYSWGMDDRLKAFELQGSGLVPRSSGAVTPVSTKTTQRGGRLPQIALHPAAFNLQPASQSAPLINAPRPGGMLSLSSNADALGSAILWALQPTSDANTSLSSGILRAFDARDLNHELWNSTQNADRDDVGLFAKFCPPVVANGKVYVASFSNQLCVFGIGPHPQASAPAILTRSGTLKDFVTLDTDEPRAVVRYTLDGTTPTAASPRYQTPFLLDGVKIIKARAFIKGQLSSPVATSIISDPDPQGPGTGLVAHYFPTRDLSGMEQMRLDDGINNNARPSAIPPLNWSARWTGEVQAPASGTYTFITDTDDGARLWVGDKQLIDDWNVHGTVRNSAKVELEAGKRYPIKMEYFQGDSGFNFQLSWIPPDGSESLIPKSCLHAALEADSIGSGTGLEGHYFVGTDLKGSDLVRVDAGVNNAPPPQGIPTEGWSARWVGQVQAPRTGTYSFSTTTDDGARLWIDGKLLIDDWNVHGTKENSATIDLKKGERYSLVMEYFQGVAGFDYHLMWTPPDAPKALIPPSQLYPGVDKGEVGSGDGLLGHYFSNEHLDGTGIVRVDAGVNTVPAPQGIPADGWSARWTGQVLAPLTGTYTFTTNTDDGARLSIDGKLLIDDWNVHATQENKATIKLERGRKYAITMEYFQHILGSTYQLLWSVPGQTQTLIPQSQLYSGADPGSVGTGQGLTGYYFANTALTGRPLTLPNQKVDVDSRPHQVSDTNWSARWQGELQATHTGTFTLSTISDDGVRLWLGERLLIDDWNVHGDNENKVTIDLVAGRKYPICLDYFQGESGSRCQLLWTTPQGLTLPIPQSQLYGATNQNVARAPLQALRFMKPGDKIPGGLGGDAFGNGSQNEGQPTDE